MEPGLVVQNLPQDHPCAKTASGMTLQHDTGSDIVYLQYEGMAQFFFISNEHITLSSHYETSILQNKSRMNVYDAQNRSFCEM